MTTAHLAPMDPTESGSPYTRVANRLRAAILTGKYAPGDRLPTQEDLVEHFGVSRETVKKALRELRSERLIVTRQGSGSFVRAQTQRPVGLRPHIEAAFERDHVRIDFAGFSGETLHNALQEPLDKIRAGRLTPESVHVRILLPDMTSPSGLPTRADGSDDPRLRTRASNIARRSTDAIKDSLHELAELRLVRSALVEVRAHTNTSLVKLFILNDEEVFFGFYPVLKHSIRVEGTSITIRDVMGKDSTLFHFTVEDDDHSGGAPFVEQARNWFESLWTVVAREYAP